MKRFKICGELDPVTNEQLYWSNQLGWVDFNSATEFSEYEIKRFIFPIGYNGKIVEVSISKENNK